MGIYFDLLQRKDREVPAAKLYAVVDSIAQLLSFQYGIVRGALRGGLSFEIRAFTCQALINRAWLFYQLTAKLM